MIKKISDYFLKLKRQREFDKHLFHTQEEIEEAKQLGINVKTIPIDNLDNLLKWIDDEINYFESLNKKH